MSNEKRPPSIATRLLNWADAPRPANRLLPTLLHPLLRLVVIAVSEFQRNELSLRAGALTYTILLSLVPILAMSTALVKGLGGSDQLRVMAYGYVATLEDAESRSLPDVSPGSAPPSDSTSSPKTLDGQKLTVHLRSALDRVFDYVDRTNFTTLGSLGMAGILLSVLLVLSHIEAAMNAIWKVTSGRSMLRKITDYLMMLILLPIAVNIAFAAGAFLESQALAEKFSMLVPLAWMQTLLLKMLPVLVIALTLYLIYVFFPNTRVATLPALSGAFLAATGWFALQNLYISLQVGVANYNAIYGSFATLPLFLVWVYLGWLFVLGGAQLAYAWQHLNSHRLLPTTATPVLRLACAFDTVDQVAARFQTRQALTQPAAQLPAYQAVLVDQVVGELVDAGLLHRSQSDGRILPAGPGGKEQRGAIITVILGGPLPDTAGGRASAAVLASATEPCPAAAADQAPYGEGHHFRQTDREPDREPDRDEKKLHNSL